MKPVAHQSLRNKLYKVEDSKAFLYVNADGRVGFGYSKEKAAADLGNHGHWLTPSGKFPHYVHSVTPIILENK